MALTAREKAVQRVAEHMDPEELRRTMRVKAFKARHVTSDRDALLQREYKALVRNTQIESEKIAGLVIMGQSGSGKTHLIKHLANRPEFQAYFDPDEPDHQMLPYISLDAPPNAKPEEVLAAIIRKCGFPVAVAGKVDAMLEMAWKWLQRRRVLFIHIDEFQHALRSHTALQRQGIQDVIKELVQLSSPWPVQVILSGTPALEDFRAGDKQLRGRTVPFELKTLGIDNKNQVKTLRFIVDGVIAEQAGLKQDGLDEDFIYKLLKAANFQFGNMVHVVKLACELVILEDGDTVRIEDFQDVYARLIGSDNPEENMFGSKNWKELQVPDAIIDGEAFKAYERKRRKRTFKVR